jgi:hypothetical protein
MYELPPHLQSLNAIQPSGSPPSSALSADQEAEFWAFMNTDELFSNFGIAPQAFESKQQAKEEKTKGADPTTLESFLATFVGETAAPTPTPDYLLAALGAPLTTSPPSATAAPAPTPAPAVRAEEDDDDEDEDDDDDDAPRVTGAKRLKMMGAGQAEIEEDKRRRNTEASARFRAKKKAREKALEDRASAYPHNDKPVTYTDDLQRSSRLRSLPSLPRRLRWRRRTTCSSLLSSTARVTRAAGPASPPAPTACRPPSPLSASGNSVTSNPTQSRVVVA